MKKTCMIFMFAVFLILSSQAVSAEGLEGWEENVKGRPCKVEFRGSMVAGGFDSVYAVYEYDINGNLFEASFYGPDGKLRSKAFFSCLQDGSVTYIHNDYFGAFMKRSGKFNARKKLVESRYSGYGEQSGSVQFVYDESDVLVSSVQGNGQGMSIRHAYKYMNGLLAEINSESRMFQRVSRKEKQTFAYDAFGNRILKEVHDGSGQLRSRIKWIWDENRNCLEETEFDGSGQVAGKKSWKYKYDAGGNCVETALTRGTGPTVLTRYAYDDGGRCVEISTTSGGIRFVYEDRVKQFRTMIDNYDPASPTKNAVLLNEAGWSLFQQKRYREALPFFSAARILDPLYEFANYNYACARAMLVGQGVKMDIYEIIADLQRSIMLDPAKTAHMRGDSDLDPVRTLPEFRNLIYLLN